MFNYLVQTYEDGAWQDINKVALPITDGDVLDETLAEGKFDLRSTSRVKPIKPFTRVRVKLYDGNTYKGKIQRVAGDTKRTTKRIAYPRRYDHDIQTLELTKIMERITIGTMTATKWLEHDFALDSGNADPTIERSGPESTYQIFPSQVPEFLRVYKKGNTITVPASNTWLNALIPASAYGAERHQILSRSGAGELINKIAAGNSDEDAFTYTLDEDGSYTLETRIKVYGFGSTGTATIDYKWEFVAYTEKQSQPQNWTITSIVERLLAAGKTRRVGETQKITFNAEQAIKYSQTPYDEPPEFGFTNYTLLDALIHIGGKIHAIPRLQVKDETENSEDLTYELVFDELGGNDDITDKMPRMLYEESTYSINDFVGTLDSPAQNLVNTHNIEKGAFSEFGEQYITMRTETSQVEISADTAAEILAFNANRIFELWCYYNGTEVNITPYLYEEDEYVTLSQLSDSQYPYSTGWAVCYKKGTNKITGFNNKLTTATVITKVGLKYAIANILKTAAGINLPESDVINLAFKVIYAPEVETRITQRKPFADENDEIVLFYNQGANMVEADAFGQKMRGAVARLGQLNTRRTYDFFSLDNLPKVGQIIDGAYIAQVDCAYYQTKVRCTVTLTPKFNLLSQYVGLNTNYRLSDISKDQVYNRFITYGESLVFGNFGQQADSIIPPVVAFYAVKKMLEGTANITVPRINTSLWIGYDKNLEKITDSEILRPVVSFPFGTSWAFMSVCQDNYGAGYQATDQFVVDGKYKRVQRLVPYTDFAGEIEHLAIWYSGNKLWDNNAAAVADGGQANIYPKASTAVQEFFKNSSYCVAVGGVPQSNTRMTTKENKPFVLMKDNRERIGVIYQMHLQANRETIVIGSALAENCPLCTNYQESTAKAYILPNTINTFGAVDFTGATETTFTVAGNAITVAHNGADNVKSWVIVDDASKQIYIGENTSENQDGHFPIVYMTTK